MANNVTVTRKDRVATLTLNRPDALNALDERLVKELTEALDEVELDPGIGAILLTGSGKAFAAGADLREMLNMDALQVFEREFSGCCERVATVRLPVIAAVSGYALGGGCEIVEMCDIVIAGESAKFGHPEITVGTMPGAGGSQRLIRAIGRHKACDLLFTGRMITAQEAEKAGLVSRVVPDDRVLEEAHETAARIAGHSRPVLMMLKEAVNHALAGALSEGLALERRLFHMTFATRDRKEGMAAFVEKRQPRFEHR